MIGAVRVFLSGPMGAGKSTIAGAVAEKLGTHAVDLDAWIERRASKAIPELFAQDGEGAFRALERQALRELPSDAGVVALGGGTVTDHDTRQALLREGILVTLTASIPTLAARVGSAESRPLLGAAPAADLARIVEARADAYAEAHAVLDTETFDVPALVSQVIEVHDRAPVVVPLGTRSYGVDIGKGVRHRVGVYAEKAARGRAILVFDGGADRPWPAEAARNLARAGKPPIEVQLQGDEASKNVRSVERIWDTALEAEVDRRAIMIGVGGGVIGDLTGFAASTLLRGVALGQVPTTLLSMVDSSVGGKTGFNRARGKNLVGTFHQPSFVLCDIETLSTLPVEERIAGFAEVVKSAWLDSDASVAMLERDADALLQGDEDATIRAVRMSVQLKARVVHEDEHEGGGQRMLLNLGHTVCHALEAACDYRGLRHGEGVALGLIAAMRVAQRLGGGRAEETERLTALLRRLGLPTDLDPHLDARAIDFIGSDKKRRGDQIHFVIPRLPGDTKIELVALKAVKKALLQ